MFPSYMLKNTSECLKLIEERIRKRKFATIPNTGLYKEASVLIPIFEKEKELFILFTKRSTNVEHHKGQISFPGGGVDRSDLSLEHTALRETYEEIGIKEEDVRLLGRVDDVITYASGYIVHPFVGVIPYPYEFKINKIEVEKILSVPISFLFKDGSARFRSIYYDGKLYNSIVYEYNGNIIWGATARIVKNFIDIISGRSSVG